MAFNSIWSMLAEVGGFWKSVRPIPPPFPPRGNFTKTSKLISPQKAYGWWTKKTPENALLDVLAEARSYEEWEEAAFQLDELLHTDLWRQSAPSKHYDYRLMNERRRAIINAREEDDILGLVNLLRSGLVRNLGNITTPRLFNRAYAGTKLLIEEYITQVALAIEYVTALPTTQSRESGWTSQAKLDLLHDTRQAFGRSTLVLQGGAMFGLCHLGVVKALHLRGLLPRIITGTATGALIAALVGIHTEDELLDFLNGDGIDLTAFTRHSQEASSADDEDAWIFGSRIRTVQTILRRTRRFIREGYFLDVNVLEECVRANVGDLTFEEAYARTRRVLNITVATSGRGGVPNLLNYLTAPNVVCQPHFSIHSACSIHHQTDTHTIPC
jgi:TAG lipase/lysophosphatidylethanolamine acyltransferase